MKGGRRPAAGTSPEALDPDLLLPASLLLRYLFFLARRPISASNRHFLVERVVGLRSLAPLLSDRSSARLDRIAARVRALTPANLLALSHEIVAALTPLVPRQAADDVVVSTRAPEAELLGSARRVRLILGPGIGIGDEMICLSLPSWLRTAAPDAEVHLLSTRPDLWRSSGGVADVQAYADYSDLVRALRSEEFPVVVLADFEKPALAPSLTREPGRRRYVELSLGARTLTAFDGRTRCLHELRCAGPYFANYYDFAAHALGWLGATASRHGRPLDPRAPERLDGRVTLFVSPFTSKHEPSEAAWSQLLGALIPDDGAHGVRMEIDPGPNLSTERFAVSLARATRARAPAGLECEVAHEQGRRTLPLPAVIRAIQRAHAVICADTFAAHAAPLNGRTTLVVAGDALENWRVPHAPVFYFSDDEAPAVVARAMRRVLAALDGRFANGATWHPCQTPATTLVGAATARLKAAADRRSPDLSAAYDDCSARVRELVAELPDWPRDMAALLADRPYGRLLPPLRSAGALARQPAWTADLAVHVGHLLGQWENSNLCKYLALCARAEGA